MDIDFKKEFLDLFIIITSIIVTTTSTHGIRLHLNNNFAISNYNEKFFINLGSLIITIICTHFLFIILKKNKKIKHFFDNNHLLESSLKSLTVMTIKNIIKSLLSNKNMFSTKWLQTVFLVISSTLIINIIFKPFISFLPFSKFIGDAVKSIFVTLILDFIVDLKLDKPLELGVSFAGVIIGDLTETPLSNLLENTDKPIDDELIDSQ